MSKELMLRVRDMDCETPTQKLVLIILAVESDEKGRCSLPINSLADKCSLHRTAVIRQIARLEEIGRLEVKRSVKGKEKCINEYVLCLDGKN